MGTNYYCYEKNHRRKHIGKKSGGWKFLFRGYDKPDFQIKSYEAWRNYLLSNPVEIFDEAHEKVEMEDFFKIVDDSIVEKSHSTEDTQEGWHDQCGYAFFINKFS